MHFQVALTAGPQVELFIDARSAFKGQVTNLTHDMEEPSNGVTFGPEIEIVRAFFISPRYFQGLNHIAIGKRPNVK